MKNLISIILLILIFFNYSKFVKSKNCKIAVLLSGDFSDLGYNYQFNEARVKAESILKLSDFSLYYKNLDESEELSEASFKDAIAQGANLIVVASSGQTEMGLKYAKLYKDSDIYWIIKTSARPVDYLPKVAVLDFNTDRAHFTLGYFAGKMSKTGVVGFVSPGAYIASNGNAFYLGAKEARSNITFVTTFTGSWFNPEVAYKAAEMLISNGADFLGMSQDDMSVQKAVIDSGSLGLGVTGYPTRLIYGSANIGLSYITDWTDVFVKYASHVINDTWPDSDYYKTSLNPGGSLLFDEYSYLVPQSIRDLVNNEIEILKNDDFNPFRCNPMYIDLGYKLDVNGCISYNEFEKNQQVLKGDKYSKTISFGTYTIPIEFVDYSSSMKLGITITSSICIFLCIISIIIVLVFRTARIIKSASPAFLFLILMGCILIFIGCIIFSQSPNEGTCRARVWLLSIGYTIFLGSLLVKNWRIWLLFDNPKLKKRSITNWKLYPWVAGILAADVLILAFWQGLGNIRSESRIGIDSLTKYQYTNVCSSNDQGSIALYILLVFHGIKLLVACFISFKIKVVDIDEFNESKPIASSVYIITFCLFIVIPLMVSPQSVTSQVTTICVCAIVTTLISIILLFGSKFYKMITQGAALNQTFASSSKSSSFSQSLEKKKTGEEDDSESSEENGKKAIVVTQQSVLAHFSSDTEDDENETQQIDEEKDEQIAGSNEDIIQPEENIEENNVSVIQSKRLSNQLNGEVEIDSNNL
ncbi:G-protein-coupled receptor family 3 protein 2 [Dictyostelium discoideum AX4]|uniref:Metabotropic glutamate receptor-like protein B n=1 Tax=Dictyostelium discoideum TaxID=44689 RepID=GRLB_DICDI|nr:G-protein-coupled receptor family 3 protein 2 [Dictyostelium discoideum AX4]Q86HH3.2 RecName: Full=Metabotropic glutamate receptor-like protein B; Flags: Precursor [Dictyostelium discoideum]EAL71533.1 G-protein-coupled receptor family 3 protein 2 [Dictyostelium discoideum AX4]|eukprot:XP_645480.1 G-protein-coupled receptor family 3 protein 2 [Dictyostelium discoideum AX4]